ncbi:MAG: YhfC family intramembrane metalloprotease [Caldilineales bacterium]|nr:YhfC family intramembrane metalloprotease [Caldilineales bacterium]
MLTITYAINALLMILIPLALGWWLARKYGLSWRLFIAGGIAFVLAQLFHIPINAGLTLAFRNGLLPSPPQQFQLVFNAIVLGATAAFTEELARFFVLKFPAMRNERGWSKALMYGAGHGGVEAIFLGILAAFALVQLTLMRDNPGMLSTLSAEQQAAVQTQLAAYWSAPWLMTFLGAVERAFALCIQVSLAVLVMQAFLRRQIRWLWFAIGWHWLVDSVSVFSSGTFGALATEGIVAVFALISLGFILLLHPSDLQPQNLTHET